ncbi:MAG: hypothetical protein M0C28_34715 [Candidatus Moduliflexus flocculans]|nr:hypothetical protein [Candidatus Moduliflexus flocculans]
MSRALSGIKLPENFLAPYAKPNLTQFWSSWHITLTQWIRSYFFNPFNRWIRGYSSSLADDDPPRSTCDDAVDRSLARYRYGTSSCGAPWHGLGLFLQNRWSDFAKTRIVVTNPRLQTTLQVGGVLLTFTSSRWGGSSSL